MNKYCNNCKSNKNGACIETKACVSREGDNPPSEYRANTDMINHPLHYANGKIECIDALESATDGLSGIEAVCTANAIKYLWRWKRKNGIEDLKKAKWYIDRLIEKQGDSQC